MHALALIGYRTQLAQKKAPKKNTQNKKEVALVSASRIFQLINAQHQEAFNN